MAEVKPGQKRVTPWQRLVHQSLFRPSPAFSEISSIRSIDLTPCSITQSSRIISGCSYFMHKYSFSRVLRFICGHSLQAQVLLGGAGIEGLMWRCKFHLMDDAHLGGHYKFCGITFFGEVE